MSVAIVVAMATNRVIGRANGLPWNLPEDLKHFKRLTMGHPIVMGRSTYQSIGRPLPGRTTVVLTRDRQWSADGVEVAHSIDEALQYAQQLDSQVYVTGGAQVYADVLDRELADELVVSRVHGAYEGDTYFPEIDWQQWQEVARVPNVGFDIVSYQR